MKKSYLDNTRDSKKHYLDNIRAYLDLVLIDELHGFGNHIGFYGVFILAFYDENREEYQSVYIRYGFCLSRA